MNGSGRRNVWLRMTDSIGVTEPGKKPAWPSPLILQVEVGLGIVSALVWILLATKTQGEVQVLYGVLVVLSLVLAAGNFVMLHRSRKDKSEVDRQADKPTQ